MCKGCGHHHYNFQPCAVAAKARKAPDYERPPSTPEGFREWGNKLDSYDEAGGVLWLKEKKHEFFTGTPVHFPSPDEPEAA
jgi:hypothetical protein